jgi:beclin 1
MQAEKDLLGNFLESFAQEAQILSPKKNKDDVAVEQVNEKIERVKSLRESVKSEVDLLHKEEFEFTQLESECLDLMNEYEMNLSTLGKEYNAGMRAIANIQTKLAELRRTNIYDDAFNIYYDGHYGTINNSRLGRLQSVPVDVADINAALGQCVHLLFSIASLFPDFQFSRYELIPKGSYSRIKESKDSLLEL